MRTKPSDIEIKEPPMQELNKKRSCLKRSCATGSLCILLFLLANILLLRFALHPPAKKLDAIPSFFPSDIPIYDKDAMTSISYVSGKRKNRWIELASYVPKIVGTPILNMLEKYDEPAGGRPDDPSWRQWTLLLKRPTADRRDTIRMEWADLGAPPSFIMEYYRTELGKKRYETKEAVSQGTHTYFLFQKGNIDGTVFIADNPKKDGTDSMELLVNIPASEGN